MKVVLIRDGERVEIEGDDDLMIESLCYSATFERQVKLVTEKFYQHQAVQP